MNTRSKAGAAIAVFALALPGMAKEVADTIGQRVLACVACHAQKDRDDAYFPRISGKPEGYLYNQLLNFREGRRQAPMMAYMTDRLPNAYLHEIAAYFSGQHLPPPKVQPTDASAAVLERGRQLVRQGDAAIKAPACVACHGERLTGVAPAIPGLAGLPRDYVNAQFGAWKNHVRAANAPDCMAEVASRLSLADVSAISAWLGAQPLPADMAPATSIARPLPLACGSAPEAK